MKAIYNQAKGIEWVKESLHSTPQLFALELVESVSRGLVLSYSAHALYNLIKSPLSDGQAIQTILKQMFSGNMILYTSVSAAAFILSTTVLARVRGAQEDSIAQKARKDIWDRYNKNLGVITLHNSKIDFEGSPTHSVFQEAAQNMNNILGGAAAAAEAIYQPMTMFCDQKVDLEKVIEQSNNVAINTPKLLRSLIADIAAFFIISKLYVNPTVGAKMAFSVGGLDSLKLIIFKKLFQFVFSAFTTSVTLYGMSQDAKLNKAKHPISELLKGISNNSREFYLFGSINSAIKKVEALEDELSRVLKGSGLSRMLSGSFEAIIALMKLSQGVISLVLESYIFGIDKIIFESFKDKLSLIMPQTSYLGKFIKQVEAKGLEVMRQPYGLVADNFAQFTNFMEICIRSERRHLVESKPEVAIRLESVEIRNKPNNIVSKQGISDPQAFRNWIELKFGELTVIRGDSGLGKSSLLDGLMGVTSRVSGHIVRQEKMYSDRSYSQFIASSKWHFTPDTYGNLLTSECAENSKPSVHEINNVLRCFFSAEEMERNNIGADQECKNLSDGQHIRLLFAKAVVQNSRVIFADESLGKLKEVEKTAEDVIGSAETSTKMLQHYAKHGGEAMKANGSTCLQTQQTQKPINHCAVIVVSHQLDIIEGYANKVIEFKRSLDGRPATFVAVAK